MTIKHLDKNISAEFDEEVITGVSLNNGILTFTKKDFYNDIDGTSIRIDLKDIKLRIYKLGENETLNDYKQTNDAAKILKRETHLFLVPLNDSSDEAQITEEGIYEEFIWDETQGDFESIGSTRINLDPIRIDITQLQSDVGEIQSILDIQDNDSRRINTIESTLTQHESSINSKVSYTEFNAHVASSESADNNLLSLIDNLDSTKADINILSTVATTGSYNDLLSKPNIPEDVSDLTDTNNTPFTPKSHIHTINQITDFPQLANVATTGSYNDLLNKPNIPEVNDLFFNNDFKYANITVTRNGVTSKETWLLTNAYYDEDEEKFFKIDPNEKAFGIQFQASGTYPGEEYIDTNNQAIAIWRCPSYSELVAAFGQQTVDDMLPNGEIGWSFDNGQTWTTFGVMAGWNNLVMFDSYGGFTVGGNGIEIDGNGIFPFMRVTSSKYTSNNVEYYLYGILVNAYHGATGADNTDRAWFFGIKSPQKVTNGTAVVNTSDLSQGSFVVMYNDSGDTSWSSGSWTEMSIGSGEGSSESAEELVSAHNIDSNAHTAHIQEMINNTIGDYWDDMAG